MFCDRCGTRLEGPANFCPTCGKSFAAAARPILPYGGRVAGHVRTLAILWMVRAVLRILPGFFLTSMLGHHWPWFDGVPFMFHGVLRGIGGMLIATGVLGLIAGWGLLERRSWARTLSLVLSIFAMFDFPFGTAIGIYTWWVLGSAQGETEYRSIARTA
jgi:hypothetical protein